MSKILGDQGEVFVADLLTAKGYSVRHIGGNYPVIDLEVEAVRPFRVSVKTSQSKRHVRMGTEKSVLQLRDDDFVFALMPISNSAPFRLVSGGYELLIVPGTRARIDALHIHRSWLAQASRSGAPRSPSAGVIVKEYSGRAEQREVWARWRRFEENWQALPSPK